MTNERGRGNVRGIGVMGVLVTCAGSGGVGMEGRRGGNIIWIGSTDIRYENAT